MQEVLYPLLLVVWSCEWTVTKCLGATQRVWQWQLQGRCVPRGMRATAYGDWWAPCHNFPPMPLAHTRGSWPLVACARSTQSLLCEQEASHHVQSAPEPSGLLKTSKHLHSVCCLCQRRPIQCRLASGFMPWAACARAVWSPEN